MAAADLDNVEDIYPLAPIQQGMLFHAIAAPESGVFISQLRCELQGPLDTALLQEAWGSLVAEQPILRTLFLWDGVDEPLQVVRAQVTTRWLNEDWRELSRDAQAQRRSQWMDEERSQGFELANAPLVRFRLAQLDADRWCWLWTFHHLILDGWSTHSLLQQVFSAYRRLQLGGVASKADGLSYRDYIAWRMERPENDGQSFWTEQLAGFKRPTPLPAPTSNQATNQVISPDVGQPWRRQRRRRLSPELSDTVRAFAAGHRLTLGTVVHGAWAIALGQSAATDDLVFGSTVAGRASGPAHIEDAIGCFINTLPCRVTIDREATVSEWLAQLQQRLLVLREWEHSSLAAIQRWSELPPGKALFESILVVENYPAQTAQSAADAGLLLHDVEIWEYSNYPLALLFLPQAQLEWVAIYDPARFAEADVDQLLERLEAVMAGFVASPTGKLGQLRLLLADTPEDSRRKQPGGASVLALFAAQVQQQADARALVGADGELSYAELDTRASQLADQLRRAGVAPGGLVAVFMERSVEFVVAIFAVLKAGAAYVPLDPRYPAARTQLMLDEAGVVAIVTNERLRNSLPRLDVALIVVQSPPSLESVSALEPEPDPDPDPDLAALAEIDGNGLAYVMFTSGSTGRPKGVMVTHRNLLHSTAARLDYYGSPPGCFLLLSSFAFDSSVAGVFWTLCGGGTLVLPAVDAEQDLDQLTRLIRQYAVSHTLCLPTLYRLLLEQLPANAARSLHTVIVAGEVCPTALSAEHFRRLPHTRLYNEYGPTEGTVWSTVHRLSGDSDEADIAIGRPIEGVEVYLMDADQRPVPAGDSGELYIAGAGVASGYLNQPELTAEHFCQISSDGGPAQRMYRSGDLARQRGDGELQFLGRADDQLKVRGYRIEPAEIEQVLVGVAGVRECAVTRAAAPALALDGYSSHARLVGYLVLDASLAAYSPSELREALQPALIAALPDYMVPETFVRMEALPRLPNGKIDRAALELPAIAAAEAGQDSNALLLPRNDTERTLATIWSRLLGLDPIGVEDNFFELGGDSIVTIQLVSQCRQAGIRIEPRDVARHPTIAGLAAVTQPKPVGASAATAAGNASGDSGQIPLAPMQHWLLGLDLKAPQWWNHSRLFELPAEINVAALQSALDRCAIHHPLLRARFRQRDGRWQQTLAPADGHRVPLRVVELPSAVSEQDAGLQAHFAALQSSLDLSAGPLFAGQLVRMAGEPRAFLLLAAHHLIIDVLSWNAMVNDLEQAYAQNIAGQQPSLSAPTASFSAWVAALTEHVNSAGGRAELAFWRHAAASDGARIPIDFPDGGPAVEARVSMVTSYLDESHSQALQGELHAAYQTRPYDLLVTALAQTLSQWLGQSGVRVGLEDHGRSYLVDGPDVSHSVGWFTAYFPLQLKLGKADDPGASLCSIKEQLRAVPHGGHGYGALRYLSTDAEVRRQLSSAAEPEVVFNYLGSIIHSHDDRLLQLLSPAIETSGHPDNVRSHLLWVNARISEQRLVLEWSYADNVHRRETIEALATGFNAALVTLIDHCLGSAGGFTPSDFPNADLDQDELDQLLDGIE